MKKTKHITVNLNETEYNYLVAGSIKNNLKLSSYAYNKLLDKTRFDYSDIVNNFVCSGLGLDGFINYISYHYELYSKLDYVRLLQAINKALEDYYSNFSDNVWSYLKQSIEESIKREL